MSDTDSLNVFENEGGAIAPPPNELGKQGSNDSPIKEASELGKQGSKPVPFARTNSVANADNQLIAWDLIEEKARQVGIASAAAHFKVKETAIYARARRHKWKKLPDGRALAKRDRVADAKLVESGADLSQVIARHRATIVEKVGASIDKFKAKAPKNFKELKTADDIVRRSLGVDDDKPMQQAVLIRINEQIDAHNADSLPHELSAEVIEVKPDSLGNEAVKQGSIEDAPPSPSLSREEAAPLLPETSDSLGKDTGKQGGSVTLNEGDARARQFVLP